MGVAFVSYLNFAFSLARANCLMLLIQPAAASCRTSSGELTIDSRGYNDKKIQINTKILSLKLVSFFCASFSMNSTLL